MIINLSLVWLTGALIKTELNQNLEKSHSKNSTQMHNPHSNKIIKMYNVMIKITCA